MSSKLKPQVGPLNGLAVNTLLRNCFHAAPGHRLLVADWSQVEARFLAWAAGDEQALARFRLFDSGDKVNGDPYSSAAVSIYGGTNADYPKGTPQRQVGKSAELGCQYQMGGKRFHEYAIENGADWSTLGGITAFDVVKAWRTLHKPIEQFWYRLQDAFLEVTEYGGEIEVGPFAIAKIDGLVVNRLPSGRLIAYQGMSIGQRVDARGRSRPSLKYASRKGPEHTFGGKLTENATQGATACLLRRAMVELERIGIPVVLTVHDEIVAEVPEHEADEGLEVMQEVMCEVPGWCEGMPIATTGYHCDRYRKE